MDKKRARPICYAVVKGKVIRTKTITQLRDALASCKPKDILFAGRGQEFDVINVSEPKVQLEIKGV